MTNDPYVRPGDIIHIPPSGRIVTISGEVFRPGSYELLPEEGLQCLVEYYGGGFTLAANTVRIRLSRIAALQDVSGESTVFSYEEALAMEFLDRDIITIETREFKRPTVFFEGALSKERVGNIDETSIELEGTVKMEYRFYEGETLGTAIQAISSRFTSSSNLESAYVIRDGISIPVNLRRFLYFNDFTDDMLLRNNDTIIIPFYQFFVIVSGAVNSPGRYPYVPDRTGDYYINLAGGRNELQNNGKGIEILDLDGKQLALYDFIPPETKIFVPVNSFTAKFNQYGPIVATILSAVTAIFSIVITILTAGVL
jgi:protein involved in polysaccharide export with SLBB domain